MSQVIEDISLDKLTARVQSLQADGQRLVQICCSKVDDKLELQYSFDKNYNFISLRITLADTSIKVPSISKIYFCAFHYENEVHDLFGVQIEGIAVDFKGNFYRTDTKTAFNCPSSGCGSPGVSTTVRKEKSA